MSDMLVKDSRFLMGHNSATEIANYSSYKCGDLQPFSDPAMNSKSTCSVLHQKKSNSDYSEVSSVETCGQLRFSESDSEHEEDDSLMNCGDPLQSHTFPLRSLSVEKDGFSVYKLLDKLLSHHRQISLKFEGVQVKLSNLKRSTQHDLMVLKKLQDSNEVIHERIHGMRSDVIEIVRDFEYMKSQKNKSKNQKAAIPTHDVCTPPLLSLPVPLVSMASYVSGSEKRPRLFEKAMSSEKQISIDQYEGILIEDKTEFSESDSKDGLDVTLTVPNENTMHNFSKINGIFLSLLVVLIGWWCIAEVTHAIPKKS